MKWRFMLKMKRIKEGMVKTYKKVIQLVAILEFAGKFAGKAVVSFFRLMFALIKMAIRRSTLLSFDRVINYKWLFPEWKAACGEDYKKIGILWPDFIAHHLWNGSWRTDTAPLIFYDKYANRLGRKRGNLGKYKEKYVTYKSAGIPEAFAPVRSDYTKATLEYTKLGESPTIKLITDEIRRENKRKSAIMVDALYVSCFEFLIWYIFENRKVKKWVKDCGNARPGTIIDEKDFSFKIYSLGNFITMEKEYLPNPPSVDHLIKSDRS
jgi:hypothetical protein